MENKEIKGLRWLIAGGVMLTTVTKYLNCQTPSGLAPMLSKGLSLGDLEYAHGAHAFLVA